MRKILFSIFIFLFMMPVGLKADGLGDKLKGRILLQVESHGEAWYVNPVSGNRFYLGRPADAFSVMRAQGLGISNKDFDSFRGKAPQRLYGKILLKVEDKGMAYYVSIVDGKMFYLGKPTDAYEVMRKQGLGISNNNIKLINIDSGSASLVIEKEEDDEVKNENTDIVINDNAQQNEDDTKTSTTTQNTQDAQDIATTTNESQVATSTECEFLAEYFNYYKLSGTPVATKTETVIDYNWNTGGPVEVNKNDKFSIRWTGNCYFDGGNYLFKTKFDDGLKLYIDGENFLQSWKENNREVSFNRERVVEKGYHEIKVEYYEYDRNALVSVDWEKID